MAALHHPVVQGVKGFLTWLWDPRWFFAVALFCFSMVGRLFLGFWSDWSQAIISILACVVLELVLGRLVRKRWVHPVSAVMTGISIGILLTTPPNTYWPYVVGAAIAIGSKYAVRHRGRHVFNPSNLAVALLFLVAPQYGISNPSQWTNQIWPAVMILLLGAVVVTRARRWDVVTGFVITYVLLALVRSLVQGLPLGWTLGPALGAEFQLFTFFMLTDPKTTPLTVRGRVTAGVLVGVLDAVMRVARITYSPFYALVLTCMLVPWFDYRFAWTRVSVVPRPSAAS